MVKCSAERLDRVFQALSDETRRQLISQLGDAEMTVGQLAKPLSISMPAVVKHLRVLESSGLVVTEKRGRTRYCRFEPSAMEDAAQWLSRSRAFWIPRLDALAALAEKLEEK
ncbi:MAG: winged helix-turn-helix transcriptional regulator [Fimbriimonadaceae bacterium]|nr:winged helix-turn-helix transcriptional regulator [Fimbriimonadaceae bacterium]